MYVDRYHNDKWKNGKIGRKVDMEKRGGRKKKERIEREYFTYLHIYYYHYGTGLHTLPIYLFPYKTYDIDFHCQCYDLYGCELL